MKNKPLGIILAGGLSQRLFPVTIPKPLLEVGKQSLIEQAIRKLKGFDIQIVCNKKIAREISKHLKHRKISGVKFCIEPAQRDTAAAVGFALRSISPKKAPPWIAIVSGDQWMPRFQDFPVFLKGVESEIKQHPDTLFVAGSPASSKSLPTHGQYGWIVPEMLMSAGVSFPVSRFVEKPDTQVLSDLKKEGALINPGMFFGRYETFMKAYGELYPQVLNKKHSFLKLERQPIDRAIFEKFKNIRVIPMGLQWEDLGTWETWHDCVGPGKADRVKSERTFVRTDRLKSISLFGCSDLAVIEHEGHLVVTPLSSTREIKDFLKETSPKAV